MPIGLVDIIRVPVHETGDSAIDGTVTSVRRHGSMRRLELAIGTDGTHVEVDAQPDFYVRPGGVVADAMAPLSGGVAFEAFLAKCRVDC